MKKLIQKTLVLSILAITSAISFGYAEMITAPTLDSSNSQRSVDNSSLVATQKLPTAEVKTSDWDYKGIETLKKHGVITDLHGLTNFGKQSYTREKLLPLIMDAIDKKDTLNDNDKYMVERLETEYDNDILNAKWEKMHAEEAKEEAEAVRRAKLNGQKMTKTASPEEQERLDMAAQSSSLERQKMSQKEIDKKMQNFDIDDSRVKVSGDVRIRYSHSDSQDNRLDGRTRMEVKVGL